MKIIEMEKRVKTAFVIIFAAGILFSNQVLGTEFNVDYSKEFEDWNHLTNEQKQDVFMPRAYSFDVPESILEEYEIDKNIPNILSDLLNNNPKKLQTVSAIADETRYSLADNLNMRVENQGNTNECWAFSMIKALETNIAISSGTRDLLNYSERHMDYATSRTFLDGENINGFSREVGTGGLPVVALAYLTNGQGAVKEEQMPFENNENRISLSEINKPIERIVTDYIALPSIFKSYEKDENGNTTSVIYQDDNGFTYNEEQVQILRKYIKQNIVTYGAIPSMTAGNAEKYYNYDRSNSMNTIFNSTAYNCNDATIPRDHAITIVGWDDHYSKDNFAEGAKPSTDGAYIVLNSYGSNNFNNGYIYISYEDSLIESELYAIASTINKDYDYLYQSDYYGGIYKISTSIDSNGYIANVFDKKSTKNEIINSIGFQIPDYMDVEIYINPNGEELNLSSMIKVGESNEVLEPGYHRIKINDTKINADKFVVAIKQKQMENNTFNFQIEAPAIGTAYELVESDGNSYISTAENEWTNISKIAVQGVDMKKADVCIKAFITETDEEPEPDNPVDEEKDIKIKDYVIKDNYIMKIPHETKIESFKLNIITDYEYSFYQDDIEITDNSQIIKTGMKIRFLKDDQEEEYTLIVRGDTNQDGKVTLTDLSKMILHYNETEGFMLSGDSEKAADMNTDGKVSLVDISQMLVLYNSL